MEYTEISYKYLSYLLIIVAFNSTNVLCWYFVPISRYGICAKLRNQVFLFSTYTFQPCTHAVPQNPV